MAESVQSLTSLAPGQHATVVDVGVPGEARTRLLEMGLLAGTVVELVRFAPLGDPIELKVRGYHLTLHRQEAEQIRVIRAE